MYLLGALRHLGVQGLMCVSGYVLWTRHAFGVVS